MDPFNAPSWGSPQNFNQDLQQTVAKTAPLAQQWNGAQTGVDIGQFAQKNTTPGKGGLISQFAHFVGGVASETGNIAHGAASWLANQGKNMVLAVPHQAAGFQHAIMDNMDINSNTARSKQNSDKLNQLHDLYKAGRITTKDYQTGLKLLIQDNNQITESQMSLEKRISADKQGAEKATVDTAALLTTILTAGFGKAAGLATGGKLSAEGVTPYVPLAEAQAAKYLTSTAATPFLSNVEQGLTRLASSPELFAKLAPEAQKALQTATAEVVAGNAGTMTAGQITRASAVNVALKYPIYYQMLSSTGQDIYNKLDKKEYGSAVQELAFNAALILSGGAIGQALKYGGKAIGAGAGATFGRTAFLDEMSKGIGDGSPDGLYKAVMAISDPAIQKDVIKNLSAVEATNMEAVNGKDAVAAAWRVLNGMSAYEGASMDTFTHEEALTNMVNFAKAQRMADDVGRSMGLGPITVGRVDANVLNRISAAISSSAGDRETTLNFWDNFKAQSPNAAWANNITFDKQIKAIINRASTPQELDSAIRNIKASFYVEGFPTAKAKILAKMGYIPISPVKLEAPFKEGTGELTTKFAQDGDFFTKAVQPVPILDSVGKMLTGMGLSPVNSNSRVYQMFNANLADNISKLEFAANSADKGPTLAETADNIIKRLSDYSHDPTRGIKINGTPFRPITDLRQLTTKDIQAALGVEKADAKEVKGALIDSMLQVQLSARGLGDKLVDLNYKINPIAGQYARLQGALRFAWNPFFQAKLAYKTEILAQAEARGKFPTMAGTNSVLATIFPDKYNAIDSVRTLLRDNGIFDSKATFGQAINGEAINDVGVGSANLTHKLLASQERSIASMVQVQADRVGMSTEDFVKNMPDAVRDTVQMIAQYDKNSVFLNSAMARTLNLAFFPFRFEYKVASIMARSLAQTSPMTQLAVINGLYRAPTWLNSPEGQAWYSQNSDVIGLFKYFTPVATLSEVSHILGMKVDSVGSLGELGGLPFGWIPQMLDSVGLTHFGGAYVSPKTGQEIPDYVPETDKGKLSSALMDLLGSLYSYPGATAGLTSKTAIDQKIVFAITGATKKNDYSAQYQPLNEQQQSFQQTVQSMGQQTLQSNTQAPAMNGLQPTTTVPKQSSSLTTAIPKPPKSGSGSAKKKKAQFTPQLLPGQTTLGQIKRS